MSKWQDRAKDHGVTPVHDLKAELAELVSALPEWAWDHFAARSEMASNEDEIRKVAREIFSADIP